MSDAARLEKIAHALGITISDLEAHLEPFFQLSLKDTIPRLSAIENARLNVTMSYTITALFYMLLRAKGIDPQTHPVWKELARVKAYMQKVDKVEKELENGGPEQPSVRLDKEATKRVVKHALQGGDTGVASKSKKPRTSGAGGKKGKGKKGGAAGKKRKAR